MRDNAGIHPRRSRYLRHRFPPDIISHAVWLYHRYGLSFRDVEDLLAERGRRSTILEPPRRSTRFDKLFLGVAVEIPTEMEVR